MKGKEKEFGKKDVLVTAKRILKNRNICLNCLGRQFAQISTGMNNKDRGKIILKLLGIKRKEPEKCDVCDNFFNNLHAWTDKAVSELEGIEYDTFVVGCRLNSELMNKEEELWEEVGINHCEPIKSEINREFGKMLQSRINKEVNETRPNIVVLLDISHDKIKVKINPLFIYGKYKKLIRGIPQTKWDKYEESVEDIIAKPIMAATQGSAHSLHGAGREDIDARCLDFRPFVLEIKNPKKRTVIFKKITEKVNKTKVEIKDLRYTNKLEVVKLKEAKLDKTYRVLVSFSKKVENIEKVKEIKGLINQKTPERVIHRRADRLRKRELKEISWKKITDKEFVFEIKGESGLYIKELVTGDNDRTKPSISEILNNPAKVKELDVIKIHLK